MVKLTHAYQIAKVQELVQINILDIFTILRIYI